MTKLVKKDADNFDVFDDNELLGSITRYYGYVDKKIKDRRIVASRKTVRMWSARRVQVKGQPYERTSLHHRSKKSAVEYLTEKCRSLF